MLDDHDTIVNALVEKLTCCQLIYRSTAWKRNRKLVKQNRNYKFGPTPNVMVALSNIGGALCSTPQSLADARYYMPCSNADKMRKPLKIAGVPQTPETISAASGPKFTIL